MTDPETNADVGTHSKTSDACDTAAVTTLIPQGSEAKGMVSLKTLDNFLGLDRERGP